MNCFFIFLLLQFQLIISSKLYPVKCYLASRTTEKNAASFDGSSLLVRYVKTYHACSSLCRFYRNCSNFTWKPSTAMCELMLETNPPVLETCGGKAGPCGDRPCATDEMCVHVTGATSHMCFKATSIFLTSTNTPTTTTATFTTPIAPTTTIPSTTISTATTTSFTTTTSTTTGTVTTTTLTTSSTSLTTTTTTSTLTATSTTPTTTYPRTTTTSTTTTTTTIPTTTSVPITTTTTTTTTTTQAKMTLHMSCAANSDCLIDFSECYSEQCQCQIGYSFSFVEQTCKQTCTTLGTEFAVHGGNGLMGYNHAVYSVGSVQECLEKCVDETIFTCKSAELLSSMTCRLASVSWYDVPSSDRVTGMAGIDMYCRQCL